MPLYEVISTYGAELSIDFKLDRSTQMKWHLTLKEKAIYSLFNRSPRRDNYFITPKPSTSFLYQSNHMWNSCCKISSQPESLNFTTPIITFKNKIKNAFLNVQKFGDENKWHAFNHDYSKLTF